MSAVEQIDTFSLARETMNAAYGSMIDAAKVLQQPDLDAKEKRKLASIVEHALKGLADEVARHK